MKKKNIAVFGAGRFSSYIVKELSKQSKYSTILIEKDESRARQLDGFADEIYIGDGTDENFINKLNLKNIDIFVVGIGDNIQNSILICSILQDKYNKIIIAKAVDIRHEEILRKIGVNEIINLQTNAAKVAILKITNPILGTIHDEQINELDEDISIFRTKINPKWVNKHVSSIKLPISISIILIRRNKKNILVTGNTLLLENDKLILIGRNVDLSKLIKEEFNGQFDLK